MAAGAGVMGGFQNFVMPIAQGFGQFRASQQQQEAYQYQAEMARYNAQLQANAYALNAKINEQDAVAAESAAAINADLAERQKSAKVALARAQYAGRGIALEGSPLIVMSEIANNAQFAIENEIYKGAVAANQHRNKGKLNNYYGESALAAGEAQARMYEYRADSALDYSPLISGIGKGIGSLLG